MNWKEILSSWLAWEWQDIKEGRKQVNILLAATYILTREALVSGIEGKPVEAQALRAANHEIDRLIGRIEARMDTQG